MTYVDISIPDIVSTPESTPGFSTTLNTNLPAYKCGALTLNSIGGSVTTDTSGGKCTKNVKCQDGFTNVHVVKNGQCSETPITKTGTGATFTCQGDKYVYTDGSTTYNVDQVICVKDICIGCTVTDDSKMVKSADPAYKCGALTLNSVGGSVTTDTSGGKCTKNVKCQDGFTNVHVVKNGQCVETPITKTGTGATFTCQGDKYVYTDGSTTYNVDQVICVQDICAGCKISDDAIVENVNPSFDCNGLMLNSIGGSVTTDTSGGKCTKNVVCESGFTNVYVVNNGQCIKTAIEKTDDCATFTCQDDKYVYSKNGQIVYDKVNKVICVKPLCSDTTKKVGIQLIIDMSGSIGKDCPTVATFSEKLGCTLLGAIPNLIIGATTFNGPKNNPSKYSSVL
ncbi:hypothetical protein WR25_27123 isoform B [Diploscapter pachys]|uniref:Uncharacterized protein n=1 Tax=Diploscapter pachys TaxID=2018661 RepID=A0A2A2J2H4_9BILA|nr:hypothetical protein WR25_27123 isoform B [Diploscapter pachys]